MGAGRLPKEIRERIEPLIPYFTPACTRDGGEIDTKKLAQSIEIQIQADPALRVALMRAATTLAIDSAISDYFRDHKIAGTVGGRKSRIREVYRIPPTGTGRKWITKPLGELTAEDIDAIERHKHAAALHELADCKALRVLRGFADDTETAQISLDLEGAG